MKTKQCSTRWAVGLAILSGLTFIPGLLKPGLAEEKPASAHEKIAIYDSRAIAVAYMGSPLFQKELAELKAKHQKAKAAGDAAAVARYEAEGKAMQVKAHKQGFSTAPVDEILARLTNAVAEIQKSAGVAAMVSKWDEAGLKKHAGAERVDVTMRLVDAFKPDERQRKTAVEVQKHKPISLEQAEQIND